MNFGKLPCGVDPNESMNTFSGIENKSLTGNITEEYISEPFHPVTTFIEQYTIPIICHLGIIGNTLSTAVFLQKPLRKSSCCIFLAARGVSDNGFLSTLFVIWISQTFGLQLGKLSSSCKMIIFMSYVCGCVSVWLVVFVTLENYIRTCKPFIVKRICRRRTAQISVVFLCIISICLYSFPFWAMNIDNCEPIPYYHNVVQALIYIDTVITLVVPLLFIVCLMTAIVCDLIKSYSVRKRTTTHRNQNPLAKVTKMLLAVTLTFFCFNLPSHAYRLTIMISSIVQRKERKSFSIHDEAIQQTTLLMSYLSFSTNIIVYTIFGSNFRKVLLDLLHLQILPKRSKKATARDKIGMALVNNSRQSNHSCNTIRRSLSVLLKNNEYVSEVEPLHRSNTR